MTHNSPLRFVLFACLGSVLIGSSAIFVRVSDLGPITTGFYRMLFALPLLFLWVRWEQKLGVLPYFFPVNGMGGIFIAGVAFAIDLTLWNWSIDYTTIVNATLLNNTAAFFVPLFTWLLFQEKQSLNFFIAAGVGFLGCLFLVGESISLSLENLLGDIIAIISGVMVALYLISIQRIREEITTGFLMFWTGIISVLFLGLFAYLFQESFWPLTVKDIISVFGQAALVHVVGQSLLTYSLGKIPAAYTALILFLAPVTAAILGWIIYGEALSFIKIIGMILVMLSIISVRRKAS